MKKLKIKGMFESMGQKYYNRINQAVIAADFRKEFKDDLVFVSDPEKEAKKEEKRAKREARIERRKEKLRKLNKRGNEEVESRVEENAKDENGSETKEKPQRYQRGKTKDEIEKINEEPVSKEGSDTVEEELQKRKEAVAEESLDDVVNKLVDMAYGNGLIMNQTVNDNGVVEYESWEDFAKVNNLDNNIDHSSWLDTEDESEYQNGFEEGQKVAREINQKLLDVLDTQQEIGKEDLGLA